VLLDLFRAVSVQGLTNRQIAQRLFVTQDTVETHLRHVFQKLDIASRSQLAPALDDNRERRGSS